MEKTSPPPATQAQSDTPRCDALIKRLIDGSVPVPSALANLAEQLERELAAAEVKAQARLEAIVEEQAKLRQAEDRLREARSAPSEMDTTACAVYDAALEAAAVAVETTFGGRAHTYASENADIYRAQDHAIVQAAKRVRALKGKR